MTEKAYYIRINGQAVEVSEEVYREYYRGRRKERYIMEDLKTERFTIDQRTGNVTITPSREDSLDRLLEADKQFPIDVESAEDEAITAVMVEQLRKIIHTLSDEEQALIHELFYLDKTMREAGEALHVSAATVFNRREKLLKKLRGLLDGKVKKG